MELVNSSLQTIHGEEAMEGKLNKLLVVAAIIGGGVHDVAGLS
jgi:hypothetical protein